MPGEKHYRPSVQFPGRHYCIGNEENADGNKNKDSAQKIDTNLLSGMEGTPKRKEVGVEPKPIERGEAPQMGPFQTFVADNSTCDILRLDTPVQSNPRVPR